MEVLVLLILAGAAFLVFYLMGFSPMPRQKPDRPSYNRPRYNRSEPSTQPRDAADQLRIVMQASFQKARLMSRPEYDVFRVVEAHLRTCGPGFRLMAQTSMGEILASSDDQAFRCINSKRLDMLVIDTFGFPVVAIEHQGNGHFQGDAPARDAVKREALRKAGVEFLEIFDHHQPADMCRMVSEAIERSKPPAAQGQIPPRQQQGY